MTTPAPDGIPLAAQLAHLPTGTAATRLDTLDNVVLTLGIGTSTHDTATDLLAVLENDLLAAVCSVWGITAPLDQVRADPITALGPLAHLTVRPGIIPPQIARRRA